MMDGTRSLEDALFDEQRAVLNVVIEGSYWAMLRKYISVQSPIVCEEAIVVNLGCGTGRDAEVQAEYVLEKMVAPDTNRVRFYGVDIDPWSIQTAKKFARNTYDGRVSYDFMVDDARELDHIVRNNVDVFFISHPETVTMNITWKEIVGKMKLKHKASGLLVATFHNEDEMDAMKTMLGESYIVEYAGRNEHATKDTHFSIYHHQFVLVTRKKV